MQLRTVPRQHGVYFRRMHSWGKPCMHTSPHALMCCPAPVVLAQIILLMLSEDGSWAATLHVCPLPPGGRVQGAGQLPLPSVPHALIVSLFRDCLLIQGGLHAKNNENRGVLGLFLLPRIIVSTKDAIQLATQGYSLLINMV